MKIAIILGVFSWVALAGCALGAEQHWYEVSVVVGNTAKDFYGSSPLDIGHMEMVLAAAQAIDLHDLSDNFGVTGSADDKISWKRLPNESEVLIPSRNVFSVIALPGDPVKIWALKNGNGKPS